ncbi:DNA mismatch repair endonuclease MutL [Halonotius roseus]|uniref:DNA mismatch repair protein MutL n=1 Tax=Halonotius roseus TaxID=2511997 RepID=A0A544QSK6_9EURY|nr:DNA mismatch repair endonuclease MutL [Halonotius roseus]TQQ82411.1 DNA mismatch repair endonuclease MutL [Halonotius roseus]
MTDDISSTDDTAQTDNTPSTDDTAIHHLDDQTVQRIAAGEVVERPASVVKELIENSLDAGATRIAVAIEGGGTEGIRVRDNGHGIPESELPLAVAEHATSKISDIDDLDAGVGTLGFRGEALATIGAVSRLTVRSRPADAASGAELTVDGGDVGDIEPAGCPVGTTVEVEELFFNTPARRKFLNRDRTEFDHVNTVVSQYALANPDVAVAFEHDGREVFATEGTGSLRSAVLSVYGRDVAESMIEVDHETDGDGPIERISGLVSDPETTRSTRSYLATFVNDRYVTASLLRGAVVDAYGGQLAPDRYPFAVLFVDVPPASVDVNVHPRKTEVRFDDEDGVAAGVRDAVTDALLDAGLIRSSAPRGRSAPAETTIEPESPDTTAVGGGNRDPSTAAVADDDADTGSEADTTAAASPNADTTADHTPEPTTAADSTDGADSAEPVDPSAEDSWVVDDIATESTPTRAADPATELSSADDPSTADAASTTAPTSTDPTTTSPPTDSEDSDDSTTANTSTETTATDGVTPHTSPEARDAAPTQPTTQQTLTGETTTAERQYETLPTLRVLGQLYDTYLLAATDDGLVLIDQHAADERVNYERLQAELGETPATQTLAEPVSLELTAREAALFESAADQLAAIGFRAEDAGDREVAVTGVPAIFETTVEPEFLRDALLGVVESADGESTIEAAIDELLADLACHPSVTGNTSLTEGSVVELLSALDDCENPYACPHGRPVLIEITREEITDRFERDYPGHGRRPE